VAIAYVFCTFVIASQAWAQSQLGASSADKSRISAGKLHSVTDTSLASPFIAATPVFNLESSSTETTANALIGLQYSDFNFSVKFSGPVRKGSPTTFADLDGLRNKSAVEFGAGYLLWRVEDPAIALVPACERLARIKGVTRDKVDCSSLQAFRAAEREVGRPLVPYIDPGNAVFFTARVKVAREDFEFLTSDTLADGEERHTSSSFIAGVAWLARTSTLLGFNYRHEQAFAPAGDPTEVCKPVGSTGALRCDEAIIGSPNEKNSELVQIEVRHFLTSNLAISPRLTRNVTQSVTGFEFPMYFLANTDGGLTGGVNASWRSDQRGPSISIFVGQVLSLFTK